MLLEAVEINPTLRAISTFSVTIPGEPGLRDIEDGSRLAIPNPLLPVEAAEALDARCALRVEDREPMTKRRLVSRF